MEAPRRRLDRIVGHRWWRWQTLLGICGAFLCASAFLGALTSYIDERSDVANDQAGRLRDRRADYEAECRFQLSAKVTGIEGQQIDGLTDLLAALANDDGAGARQVVGHLADLKDDKAEAEAARVDAVDTCNRQARDLYPSD